MSVAQDRAPQPRHTKRLPYSAIFDAPDQDRVHAELATFFGPHADVYLAVYEKMRAAEPAKRMVVRAWSWPVFLGSFTWFFYRKMYAYGAIVILLPLAVGYLFGSAGGGVWLILAIWAKAWYVNAALARITKADQLGLAGAERSDYLRRAGGVSMVAGIFAGAVFVLFLVLAVANSAGYLPGV